MAGYHIRSQPYCNRRNYTPRRHLLRIVRICAKAQMLIHSAVPPLPHKIIFDAFPGTPLCEIAVLQTARFHPKENCIFLALLCSYPFAAPA